MKLTALVILVSVALVRAEPTAAPQFVIEAIRQAGIPTLSSEIQTLNEEMKAAIEAFVPVNATCTTLYNTAFNSCKSCVETECRTRAESVCRPEAWQVVLSDGINFLSRDVPNFFTQKIPDVFVNDIGGEVVDLTKDVGSFLTGTVGGGLSDLGDTVGDGIVDFGDGIRDGLVDLGNGIGDVAVDGLNAIKGGLEDLGNALEDLGNDIGDAFNGLGGLFEGRRKRSLMKRDAEPSCDDITNDASSACLFYTDSAYCSDCGFNPLTDCPGYEAAINRVRTANASRAWMSKITNNKYSITSMTYESSAFEATGFRGVQVSVHLFGKDFTFTVSTAINPYLPTTAGPVVAQQALNLFKSSD